MLIQIQTIEIAADVWLNAGVLLRFVWEGTVNVDLVYKTAMECVLIQILILEIAEVVVTRVIGDRGAIREIALPVIARTRHHQQ